MADQTKQARARKSRMWQGHVDGWQQSGLSQRNYCQRHGLAVSTFQLWRRRLVAERVSSRPGCLELVPVPNVLPSEPAVQSGSAAIVVCVGQYRVEVADGARVSTLRCVIDALAAR